MASVVTRPLQSPNCCFICEGTTSERFFDSRRNFDVPGRSHLKGRRYICEKCVDSAARAFDYARPVDVAAMQHAAEVAEARIAELEERLAAFQSIAEALEVVKPKRAPRAKKADESAEASA